MAAEGALELSEHLGRSKVVNTFTAIVEGKPAPEVKVAVIICLLKTVDICSGCRLITTSLSCVWALNLTRAPLSARSPKSIDLLRRLSPT
jgi:hypothetical protein